MKIGKKKLNEELKSDIQNVFVKNKVTKVLDSFDDDDLDRYSKQQILDITGIRKNKKSP